MIRSELQEIKGLEKGFMQRRAQLAKEGKSAISQDEEAVSRTLLALEEARARNQALLAEIENMRKNELNRREHQKNMRFVRENLLVLEKLTG